MKDTPRTDEWETYCDEWYYHLWRLRRKNKRGFNDGFHINNGDEAKGLCDLLNNLEAELTAAREESDKWEQLAHDKLSEVCRQIEKTRAVTKQRDGLLEQKEQWRLSSVCRELVEQRDRLSEALERILDYQGRFAEEEPESIARESLKLLAPNK